jgi:hypothetical protein
MNQISKSIFCNEDEKRKNELLVTDSKKIDLEI